MLLKVVKVKCHEGILSWSVLLHIFLSVLLHAWMNVNCPALSKVDKFFLENLAFAQADRIPLLLQWLQQFSQGIASWRSWACRGFGRFAHLTHTERKFWKLVLIHVQPAPTQDTLLNYKEMKNSLDMYFLFTKWKWCHLRFSYPWTATVETFFFQFFNRDDLVAKFRPISRS